MQVKHIIAKEYHNNSNWVSQSINRTWNIVQGWCSNCFAILPHHYTQTLTHQNANHHPHTHVLMHMHTHAHAHAHTRARAHTRTHTCTHTHIQRTMPSATILAWPCLPSEPVLTVLGHLCGTQVL